MTVGIEIVPSGFRRNAANRFTPLFPVADNGTLLLREVQ